MTIPSALLTRTLLLLAALSLALAPAASAQAKLVVSPPKLHLGSVYYGSSTSSSVKLKNVGNAPLVISDVKSSCGCTAATLSPRDRTIAPGAEVTLPITMTPKNGRTPLRKAVNIISNDPTAKFTAINVSCDVLRGVTSDPEFILFQNADVGDTLRRTMVLTSHNGIPFQVKNISFTTSLYQATWDRSALPSLTHTVDVVTAPITARVVKSALMTISTTHPQTPQLRINANTQVLPVIATEPARIQFPAAAPGGTSTARLKIWNRETRGPVRIVASSMQNERAYDFVATKDATNPLMWTFEVRVPAREQRRAISGVITVMTDEQSISIPAVVPIAK